MIKSEKIILIIAGLSLAFIVISVFVPYSEGSVSETFIIILTLPILVGIIILVRNRSNPLVSLPLRIVGISLFIIWILSKLIRASI